MKIPILRLDFVSICSLIMTYLQSFLKFQWFGIFRVSSPFFLSFLVKIMELLVKFDTTKNQTDKWRRSLTNFNPEFSTEFGLF